MPIFGSGEQRILYFFYNLFIYLSDFFKAISGLTMGAFSKVVLGVQGLGFQNFEYGF